MAVGMPLLLCAFALIFVLIIGLAILTQMGILNRRLAGILGLVIMLPLICGILLMAVANFSFVSGGGPFGPGMGW